ncbi:MAG: D-alanyl-D-alanine carboxypeptidase/D-alanyl-D-alanine-endopeptidase [Gammaproteobacteria bacterium]|nr:D-alanyl-D-alanine carboxypeptidase/D-alanyl-D-alanine-endopeptidase [Gammaproteobacteria bacterium]
MNKRKLSFMFMLLGATLFFTAFSVSGLEIESRIPQEIRSIFSRYKLPLDSFSLYIKDIDSAQPLLDFNADTARNPASVIKLLTTFAGLELLGPYYTWETRFYLDGVLENNRLMGNLILQGGGDPLLVEETFWHILYNLHARGLKHIDGDLVIDNSLFEKEAGSTGDFDNKPYHAYNAFPDAALINFLAHQFVFIPQNDRVLIYADPPADNLQIRNNVRLTTGTCRSQHSLVSMNVTMQSAQIITEFSGNYPASCGEQTLTRAVIPGDQYLYGVFKSLWEDLGGTISGTYRNDTISDKAQLFYVEKSKPLSEIIMYINKFSNNIMARQLLLTIGHEMNGAQGTKLLGSQAIETWLQQNGINTSQLIIDNGSGLSRDTRITARTLGQLLEHAWRSPYQPEFLASLPIAGKDGTMRKRLNGGIPPGKIRIKTGLINDVRSMAGYVHSQNDNHYIVVSLQNYPGIQNYAGTLIQDEILKWLYEQ